MQTHTDFHQKGVFAVKDADGNILFDTFADTAYSARAEFVRTYNKRWSVAEVQGYTMAQFKQVAQVVSKPATNALPVPKTVRGWSLYEEAPNAVEAAENMGGQLEKLLRAARANDRCNLEEARRIRDYLYQEMDKYEEAGARDTDPESILVHTIEVCLGLASGSLSRRN